MRLRIAAIAKEDLAPTLRGGGFDAVYVASGAAEALGVLEGILREKRFDLVLLDDVLAKEIGKSKLSEIKYKHPLPAIVELKTARSGSTSLS